MVPLTARTKQTKQTRIKQMKDFREYKTLKSFATAVARGFGCGRADEIVIGDANTVRSHTRCGWRKNTTGEYVPNAYLRNFGWKNTFYQHAHTIVTVTREAFDHFNAVAE